MFIANEIGAGAQNAVVQNAGTGRFSNGLLQVWGNLDELGKLNVSGDARGQLAVNLYHIQLTGASSIISAAYKEGTGPWQSNSNTDPDMLGTSFGMAPENIRIFSHNSVTSGKLGRVAFWPSPVAIDVDDPAVQALFVDEGHNVLLPAASHAVLGNPSLDWHAAAPNAAAGGHDGLIGALTMTTAPTIGTL